MSTQEQDVCQCWETSDNALYVARQELQNTHELQELAELFKILGDFTRVRILKALAATELCVCDLAELLESSSSAVSHQLRVLRAVRMVKYRKEGKKVFYSLDDHHVVNLLREGLEHVQHG